MTARVKLEGSPLSSHSPCAFPPLCFLLNRLVLPLLFLSLLGLLVMSQWSIPSGSIPTKRECGVSTCQCSEYVCDPPSHIFPHTLPIFITGLLVMNVAFSSLFHSFIHCRFTGNEYNLHFSLFATGLLEVNAILFFFIVY